MQVNRRDFLCASMATAGMVATSRCLASNEDANSSLPIGIQLYCVRGACQKDFAGTIESLAKNGFQGIEFWGYEGKSPSHRGYQPRELKKLLDDNGVRCCGMHVQLSAISETALANVIELNTTLENEQVIVAWAKERMTSVDSIRKLADEFSAVSEQIRKHGLRLGYHCHGFDFQRFDGHTGWDILFSHVSPDVIMQLDVGNCIGGGGEPLAVLKKFAKRAASLHVKIPNQYPMDASSPFWREVFRLAKSGDALRWVTVEEGAGDGNDLEIPRRCMENTRKLLG